MAHSAALLHPTDKLYKHKKNIFNTRSTTALFFIFCIFSDQVTEYVILKVQSSFLKCSNKIIVIY